MGELYSITGLFYEAFPGLCPWGGHFMKGIEGDAENQIVGQLIDIYGPSKLEGFMKGDTLEFRKQYELCNGEQAFDYVFSLKDGIWQGEYSYVKGIPYSGKSICKTNLCLGDLIFKTTDYGDPESWAKMLLEEMINTGYLETFEDPETGEDMIRPNK